MKDKLIALIRKIIENRHFKSAGEHIIKPFLATAALAALFFVIIYNRNENTGYKDGFFVYYALLLPFLFNAAASFARLNKRKLYGLYGFSVVLFPFLALNFYWLASKYSYMPDFYRDFSDSGSFIMLYAMYSVFFVIGGVFIGLIDEFISAESRAVLKYPEAGQLTKSKRRKLKKKKRDGAKGSGVSHEIIDEIIGTGEDKNRGGFEEQDEFSEGGAGDEENEGEDEQDDDTQEDDEKINK
jgi:hypothetical protein